MKYQKPVNTVQNNDEFSSGLMEAYTSWMGGNCFQNTDPVDLNLHEAPFDGMDPQSHGAEIEDTTKRKKEPKKGAYVGQESAPKNEEYEVLEREEYEIDGEVYVLEKVKMDGKDDNGFKSCWKGYKKQGTKVKGGKEVNDCVKAGVDYEGEEDLQEKAPSGAKYERMVKHIKKGYSKDGLTDDEKSIAYATAWKAKNKKMKEEYDSEEKDDDDDKMCGKCKKAPCKCEKEMKNEALDPVGKEDKDIDNDGDHDKSDKYLHARRKKISKILAMKGKK